MSLGASAVFLVDGTGKIIWREQFSQGHLVSKGQLTEQVRRVIAGEALIKVMWVGVTSEGGWV